MSALDDEILSLMRFAAERAILPRYRNLTDSEVEEKAKDDLVTIADKETEIFLSEALAKLESNVAIVGEEAAHADPSILENLSGPCWIIDPIDGTSNFAKGNGPFGIMVALADQGEAIAGWIYDPITGRFCSAERGKGAFINGEKFIATPLEKPKPNLAAMKRFMMDDQRAIFEQKIQPFYDIADAPGCAAEQYPLVAFGQHDLAIFERTLAWDHAAGCLFVNESGGSCLRIDGSPYRIDDGRKGMIAATDRAMFDHLAEKLQAAGYKPAA